MQTADFDFALPPDRIAAVPARPRDAARLLAVGDQLSDHVFRDLPALLAPGDLLVFNDTRVIPARLQGRRGDARIEATLLRPTTEGRWRALVRPAKRLRPGDRIDFAPDFAATTTAKLDAGEIELDFALAPDAVIAALQRYGTMPLPPYIPRPDGPLAADGDDYQTVFATRDGAVAAPTAGLHFTPSLLAALTARGIGQVAATLHVGAGTFLPVKADAIADHRMHAEWGELSAAAVDRILAARAAGGRIVAVGTTSLRLLETAAKLHGRLQPFAGDTDLFITPGFRFHVADMLITNFHLPRSTLFMLVCAFAGLERMRTAYAHAIATGYRFYSYGDGSLLRRAS